MDALTALLTRATVPPVKMTGPGPDETDIERILEAGAAAPDHGRLKPWRFVIIRGDARAKLGELFATALVAAQPDVPEADLEKQRTGPARAPLIVTVVARLDPKHPKIPEVEQIASAAAAAQNILIAAHALGFAAKWATGKLAYSDVVRGGLGLGSDDYVIGFLYIGSYAQPHDAAPRPALIEVVREWTGAR